MPHRIFSAGVKSVLFVLALCFWMRPAAAQKTAAGRNGRDTLTLDSPDWRGIAYAENPGQAAGQENTIPADAKPLAIPETPLAIESKTLWRWREFAIPARWHEQTVRLQFGAVLENADIWLNGTLLGTHSGGVLPFEFNITKTLRFDAKNLLALRIKSALKQPAGIWQSVTLIAHDEAYLLDAFPQAGRAGNMSVPAALFNTSDKSGDAELDADVFDPKKPDKFVLRSRQNLSVSSGRNVTTLTLNAKKKTFQLWTPQSPQLYTLAFDFHQAADSLDKLQVTFGFREFGYRNGAVTLNDAPLALKSAVYPANLTPLNSQAAQEKIRSEFAAFRASGVSLLYVSAPDPNLLKIADETGMLLIEGPRQNLPPPVAFEELRGLIVRDRSHPSLLGWNLGERDRAGLLLCRDLDPTRFLLVGAGKAAQIVPPNQDTPVPSPLPQTEQKAE